MVYALLAVQAATLVALVVTAGQLRRLRRENQERAAALTLEVPPAPELREQFESGNSQLITIEVLNPLELASTKASFAGSVAGALAPRLIRRVVNDKTAVIIRRKLPEEGVQAEVRIASD